MKKIRELRNVQVNLELRICKIRIEIEIEIDQSSDIVTIYCVCSIYFASSGILSFYYEASNHHC